MDAQGNISEEKICEALKSRFPFIGENAKKVRARRVTVCIDSARTLEVMDYLKNEMGFSTLHSITGLDAVDKFQILYYISVNYSTVITLTADVAREHPSVESITGIFPNAEFYEREIVDLLGIEVKGLPPGNRYPLPDGWPEGEYPLRKDWKKKGGEDGSEPKEGADTPSGDA